MFTTGEAIYGTKSNVAAYRIFVDGREVLTYEASNLDNTPGAWEMGADGTLTLLPGSPFAAGGAGTGETIGSQDALRVTADGRYLLAVAAEPG